MKRTPILASLAILALFTIVLAGCEGPPAPTADNPKAGSGGDSKATAKAMLDNPSLSQAQKDAIKKGMEKDAPAADATGK